MVNWLVNSAHKEGFRNIVGLGVVVGKARLVEGYRCGVRGNGELNMCISMFTCRLCIRICMCVLQYTNVYMCMWVHLRMRVFMCTRVCSCVRVYVHVYACMFMCMYMYMRLGLYAGTYADTYVCVHVCVRAHACAYERVY